MHITSVLGVSRGHYLQCLNALHAIYHRTYGHKLEFHQNSKLFSFITFILLLDNVEMEIVLPGNMTVIESHDLALVLQHKIESLNDVERAFVHVSIGFYIISFFTRNIQGYD